MVDDDNSHGHQARQFEIVKAEKCRKRVRTCPSGDAPTDLLKGSDSISVVCCKDRVWWIGRVEQNTGGLLSRSHVLLAHCDERRLYSQACLLKCRRVSGKPAIDGLHRRCVSEEGYSSISRFEHSFDASARTACVIQHYGVSPNALYHSRSENKGHVLNFAGLQVLILLTCRDKDQAFDPPPYKIANQSFFSSQVFAGVAQKDATPEFGRYFFNAEGEVSIIGIAEVGDGHADQTAAVPRAQASRHLVASIPELIYRGHHPRLNVWPHVSTASEST
mgnify:CR=1 FL=1